ncbi:PA14 domain-containing protein [Spirosoma oryzicola]|uniref:PA14 domain-containing protein n=1 Tax=Spirosoma oryzicola TaxID=2898794 RepID=UPI001E5682E3|nr:PA14 domain-containing protein [Spirosoma oryzicola]UHG94652.1 PA14 domain-containing protein [Spirosoma oryzicola]UHG94742.1 PA14 domain-containing protein [Spirosoma oryzicola]
MRLTVLHRYLLLVLLAQPVRAQTGLIGDYYVGTNFEQKAFSRIDPAISFNWDRRSPGKGLSRSYYSIRWRGKLRAPTTGVYEFYAKVNDGIRVWVGNKLVLESWKLNAYKHYTGSIVLEAEHYYDLRVDYFNAIEWGEIDLYWKPPPTPNSALNPFSESGEPIAADYFFQQAPPSKMVPKPISPAATKRSVRLPLPKRVHPPKLKTVKLKSIPTPETPKRLPDQETVAADTILIRRVAAEPPLAISSGATLILRTVQFEQSSYVLLAEASTELTKLIQVLKVNPHWHIHITGHTDNVGDARLNLALSEQRAKVVATYLIRRGILDERITTEGFGSTQPLGDNTTEGERSKNRRVAITIR